jgi:NitT/TauT family transport system permease protein
MVLLLLWEAIVRIQDIPALILPPPTLIASNLVENLKSGYFYPHIGATLIEVIGGFLIGTLIGLGLGFIVSQSVITRRILHPYIIASQAMPKLALAPLLILWFGYGYLPKMIIVALISFFPLFESTVSGLSQLDRDKENLFRVMRASKWQIIRKLRIPNAIPVILSGMRVAVVLSVVGAVVSEFVGANKGLGAVIMIASGMMDTPLLFSAFILLTLIGIGLYEAISLLERKLFKTYIVYRRKEQ